MIFDAQLMYLLWSMISCPNLGLLIHCWQGQGKMG
jgi:hypothetical protein